jgi:hypothetical protein
MLAVLVHERTAWNDFFTVTSPNNPYYSQTYTSRRTPSDSSVYVTNCLFKSITSSSDGGALSCTSATYFLVESTSFFSCKTSGSFGAIYFSNSGGQSVLNKVCGYDCCTTNSNSYQFGYVSVNNAASSKNYANYSSIVRCVNEYSSSHHTFALNRGEICCPSVNMSLNKCYYRSGLGCWPLYDSNSFTCSLTYSSFVDNHATGYTCFWFNRGGAKYEFQSCNILRNTQGTLGTEGTFYVNEILMISDSCILENTATYIFYQPSSYTVTLSSCTVDKATCNRNVVTQNTVTKSFILALNHMSTQNCHSKYDSAGYLTPVMQTPSSSKKQIRLCTCGECFNQPSALTPLIFLFFVSFYLSI